MRRQAFVAGMAATVVAPVFTDGQTAAKVYRVGLLTPGPAPHLTEPLVTALRERGWMVGRNLLVEMRHTHGKPERAEALAKEFAHEGIGLTIPPSLLLRADQVIE